LRGAHRYVRRLFIQNRIGRIRYKRACEVKIAWFIYRKRKAYKRLLLKVRSC